MKITNQEIRKMMFFFVCTVTVLLSILATTPASGALRGESSLQVLADITADKDFFKTEGVLRGYEHCSVYRAERLSENTVGVILLEPSGFGFLLVYDAQSMAVLHKNARIYPKQERKCIMQESISVSDALIFAHTDTLPVSIQPPVKAANEEKDTEENAPPKKRTAPAHFLSDVADAIDSFIWGAHGGLLFPFF